MVGLGFEPFSVLTLVNDELAGKRSPYLAMMLTSELDRKAPARMHVEILSNHLRDMAWQGRLRFVVTDFPTDRDQATILEEDVSSPHPPLAYFLCRYSFVMANLLLIVHLN